MRWEWRRKTHIVEVSRKSLGHLGHVKCKISQLFIHMVNLCTKVAQDDNGEGAEVDGPSLPSATQEVEEVLAHVEGRRTSTQVGPERVNCHASSTCSTTPIFSRQTISKGSMLQAKCKSWS